MHERDSAAGERWFHYGAAHPHSTMEIGGVAVVSGPVPSTDELLVLIDMVRAAHPPLRDRARAPGANARGPAAPADHLEKFELPTDGGEVALHAAIERGCAQPLTEVTWGVTLFHGHRDNEFALLLRAHHGLLDGMSLIGIMLAALGEPGLRPRRTPPKPPTSWTPRRVRALLRGVADIALPGQAVTLGPAGVRAPTGPPRRRWAHTPLTRMKAIARAGGTNLNDVYLAALAGALRPWLPDDAAGTVQAMVPLDTRRSDTSNAVGNFHRGVRVALPCRTPTAAERLAATYLATADIRSGRYDPDADTLFDTLPTRWHGRAMALSLHPRRTTLVSTYVPGPAQPLELHGHSIHTLLPLMFLPPGHHLSICLAEYAGTAHLAVVADPSLPAVDELPTRWLAELDALERTPRAAPAAIASGAVAAPAPGDPEHTATR
ncbi:WS/DGAT domain-containing protein [Embleya sp. NPDC005575]|uniref:WS/DGAT domain-containing protein n=1 Tax=Embleya sp. NPDC005575 TaxID=3156892 RepID=UPI0033AAB77E